ncbi:MAG: GGDEF domain-containing protein [Clostridia bacterium]|nr:GGDEF domain-containing protein [Clostridia bacterium]
MNRSDMIKRIPAVLISLTLIAFLCFFLYIGSEDGVTVDRAEPMVGYEVFDDMSTEFANDANAPAGVRKIYRGMLPPDLSQEDYICFNISHHNIEVYFENELAYSLTGSESRRVAHNVGSNWCIVHVGENHAGKSITVILTPLFEAAIGKNPTFLLGAPFAVADDEVAGEMPLVVISSLAILLGFFVVSVSLYFRFIQNAGNKGAIYLGFFSMSIGLWKLTDLNCMPLLIPERSISLSYISLGALFLTAVCLLAYLSTLFVKERRLIPNALVCAGTLVALTVLVLQILGITELRQNLVYSHILLITAIASVPVTAIFNRIFYKNSGLQPSWKLLVMLSIGIIVDLIFYYRNNQNGLMSFSIMGLIVYTLIIFLKSVQDATRKAYTDSGTGLINRARWMELMSADYSSSQPYAILMIDMNGLKNVNDTRGHEAGDRMIVGLSDVLRRAVPANGVVCRWGGDEFAVLLTGIDRAQLDLQIKKIFDEGKAYNAENPDLPISFAVGAVLSSEHPGITRNELFTLADEEMYRNKKAWYANRG